MEEIRFSGNEISEDRVEVNKLRFLHLNKTLKLSKPVYISKDEINEMDEYEYGPIYLILKEFFEEIEDDPTVKEIEGNING